MNGDDEATVLQFSGFQLLNMSFPRCDVFKPGIINKTSSLQFLETFETSSRGFGWLFYIILVYFGVK